MTTNRPSAVPPSTSPLALAGCPCGSQSSGLRPWGSVFSRLWLLAALLLLSVPARLFAQRDLTVVVLVNSSNTTDYNTNTSSPGTYQMGPERYLVHLQVPYKVVDVSTTSAYDLSAVQLIIAGHARLNLGADWQAAITAAVANGTGFMNLDSDPNIGLQSHIRTIFNATGSTVGSDQTSIVIPAAVQVGGATPHYIAALQRHFTGDPAGDLTYTYHGNGTVVIPSDATILTTTSGTVVARLGTDPLVLATTYGKGRAVDFTTYDYLHADRFGFVNGVDDLFWRSIVWAARKPFVLRGYPRIAAIQMDDNETGIMSRIPDLWNTTYTGTTASDGTGGPWNLQLNMQLSSLDDPGGERAQMISAIKSNYMHASPHGLDYGSGGDLYWNLTQPNTDAQWQSHVASALSWKAGQGGTDTFPTFSTSMVAHYWDISNNAGYEMWNSLGLRYITSPQAPGAYYFTVPKTPAQRIPLGPFRIYEQPPIYSGDEEETFPFFYADDLTVGSVAGKPSKTFYAFASQVGLSGGRFSRPDAVFPSSQNGYTVAQSLNQWEYYMWHFWSGMEPVQIYTHDGDNLEYTTVADRHSFIQQLSQWFSTNKGQHVFMDGMGDYLRARNHSLLTTASLTSTSLTLNFTGTATDADGHLIPTKALVFYGDDEGTQLSIPGFTNGGSYSFANTQPASMQVSPLSLSFSAPPGSSPGAQNVTVSNVGSGSFTWTVSSNQPWLTTSVSSGTSNKTIAVQINSSSLSPGIYNGTLTFTASGSTLNSPQTVAVKLNLSAPALVPSPTSLTFSGNVGGAAPAAQTVSITNPSGSNLSWTASSDSSWLSATTLTAGTPGSLKVTVAPGSMPLGVYSGNITLRSTATGVSPVTIPVSFQLSGVIASPSTANLSAWTVSPLGNAAGWTSSGGSIRYNGGGESQLYTGSSNWADYDLDVNLTLSSAADYPGGIRARVNPSTGAGYALWMYPDEHQFTLYKVVNWNIGNGYTAIASAGGITFDTNAHTLRLSVHGTTISASYDGTQVLSVTDATYANGLIALDPSNKVVAYNKVTVSSTSNQTTLFSASPTSLSFTAAAGATAPAQTVALSSSPSSVSWTATSSVPWLSASPSSGAATPASIAVTATAAALSNGSYSGNLTLTPSAGSAVVVPVSFTVNTPPPLLLVTPTSAALQAYVGQTPPSFTFAVANQSGATFSWSASSDQSWLTLSPSSGSGNATVTATTNISGLAPGSYTANITVAAPGLPNSPVVVPVTLTVSTATLSDNFSNNASGWIISPNGLGSNFSVANQTYTYNGGGNTQSCSGSPTYTNYEFDFGLRLTTGNNYPGGVRARVNPSTGAGYGLWFYPADHVVKLINFSSWSASSASVITQANMTFDTLSHNYRFVFNGSNISFYKDNVSVLSATDSAYASGYVCFDPSNQPVAFSQALVLSSASGATLTPSVSSLNFSSPSSGSVPPPQNFTLSSDVPVTYGVASSASWLSAALSTTTTPATITASINNSSLANGSYNATLTLFSPGSVNAPVVIPVSLSLASAILGVTPASADLFAATGSSPSPVAVTVQNLGSGSMPWSASSSASWLTPSPASALAPGALTLTPSTASLPSGPQTANVTVSSSGAANGAVVIPITVHLGTPVFTDNFANGSSQWTPSPLGLAANWSVANNHFLYNGGGHTQQYAGSQTWTDYIVSTDITLNNLSDYPGGLRGRVNLTNGAAYVAWLYPAEHVIKLFRTGGWNIDTDLTLLGQSSTILMDTQTHSLRLGFVGNQITVYYDNQQVITANDTVLTSGAIALDVSSQPLSFSNVFVLQ